METQRTTLSLAGVTDVDTFGRLIATWNMVQPNRQLAPGCSFQDCQGKSSLGGDSPPSTTRFKRVVPLDQLEFCLILTGPLILIPRCSDQQAPFLQSGQGPSLKVSLR